MEYNELQKNLATWDRTSKKAIDTCTTDEERLFAGIAVNIKKMELLDNYMVEQCIDENMLHALEQYSKLATGTITSLMGVIKTDQK